MDNHNCLKFLSDTIFSFALSKNLPVSINQCENLLLGFPDGFYSLFTHLCELEAQSFKSTEHTQEIAELTYAINDLLGTVAPRARLLGLSISSLEWRLIVSLCCTYGEWCFDVGYLEANEEEKLRLAAESPLCTFADF